MRIYKKTLFLSSLSLFCTLLLLLSTSSQSIPVLDSSNHTSIEQTYTLAPAPFTEDGANIPRAIAEHVSTIIENNGQVPMASMTVEAIGHLLQKHAAWLSANGINLTVGRSGTSAAYEVQLEFSHGYTLRFYDPTCGNGGNGHSLSGAHNGSTAAGVRLNDHLSKELLFTGSATTALLHMAVLPKIHKEISLIGNNPDDRMIVRVETLEERDLEEARIVHNEAWSGNFEITSNDAKVMFSSNPGGHLLARDDKDGRIIAVIWSVSLYAASIENVPGSLTAIMRTRRGLTDNVWLHYAVATRKEYRDRGFGPSVSVALLKATEPLSSGMTRGTYSPLNGYGEYKAEYSPAGYLLTKLRPAKGGQEAKDYLDYRAEEGAQTLREFLSARSIDAAKMSWQDYLDYVGNRPGFSIEDYVKKTGRGLLCTAANMHVKNGAKIARIIELGREKDYASGECAFISVFGYADAARPEAFSSAALRRYKAIGSGTPHYFIALLEKAVYNARRYLCPGPANDSTFIDLSDCIGKPAEIAPAILKLIELGSSARYSDIMGLLPGYRRGAIGSFPSDKVLAYLNRVALEYLWERSKMVPDIVFRPESGLVFNHDGNPRVFLSNFSSKHGAGTRAEEVKYNREWFEGNGYDVIDVPGGLPFEGSAEVKFVKHGDSVTMIFGWGYRTKIESVEWVIDKLRAIVPNFDRKIEIIIAHEAIPEAYHLDVALREIPVIEYGAIVDETIMYYPDAFDRRTRDALLRRFPNGIKLSAKDFDDFACNSVVIGKTILIDDRVSMDLEKELNRRGLDARRIDLIEFYKSGGGAKCLVLELDKDPYRLEPEYNNRLQLIASPKGVYPPQYANNAYVGHDSVVNNGAADREHAELIRALKEMGAVVELMWTDEFRAEYDQGVLWRALYSLRREGAAGLRTKIKMLLKFRDGCVGVGEMLKFYLDDRQSELNISEYLSDDQVEALGGREEIDRLLRLTASAYSRFYSEQPEYKYYALMMAVYEEMINRGMRLEIDDADEFDGYVDGLIQRLNTIDDPRGENGGRESGIDARAPPAFLAAGLISDIHAKAASGIASNPVGQAGPRVLLSATLFDADDRSNLERALRMANIQISEPIDMIRSAANNTTTRDNLAVVLSKADLDRGGIWKDIDKRGYVKSSVIIVDEDMKGANYLYLEGVVALAIAVMRGDGLSAKELYQIITGLTLDNEIISHMKDDAVKFAMDSIIKFKPITINDPGELEKHKLAMENFLMAA